MFVMLMIMYIECAVTLRNGSESRLETSPMHLPYHRQEDVVFNYNDTLSFNSSLMRSPTPRDWSCKTLIEWRDLGRNHFPRYVQEVKCAGTTCFHGFYSCREKTYQVEVLMLRDNQRARTLFGSAVPWTLRQSWMFKAIPVPVACICVEH